MKIKLKNRYYCEFCNKSGGSAYWIKHHEERCTLNPNRYCGYCHLLEMPQPNLSELMVILPIPKEFLVEDEYGIGFVGLEEAVEKIMPKLRENANNCPACIMAALRQKGIPVPVATSFDFKKECQSIWNEFNSMRAGAEY